MFEDILELEASMNEIVEKDSTKFAQEIKPIANLFVKLAREILDKEGLPQTKISLAFDAWATNCRKNVTSTYIRIQYGELMFKRVMANQPVGCFYVFKTNDLDYPVVIRIMDTDRNIRKLSKIEKYLSILLEEIAHAKAPFKEMHGSKFALEFIKLWDKYYDYTYQEIKKCLV